MKDQTPERPPADETAERPPAPGSRRRALARHAARILLVMAIGAVAAILLLPFVPATRHRLGPASLSTRAELATGRTVLVVPPLGAVSAQTHSGPLGFEVVLTHIDLTGLGQLVGSEPGQRFLRRTVEEGLRAVAEKSALRLIVAGVILGAVAAALLPRRRWSNALEGAAGGAVAVAIVLWMIGSGYDVEAFQEPRFTGALVSAPEVIEALNESVGSLEALQSRYENAADRLTELMALVAQAPADPQHDTVALLHVGDIHSNPLGLQFAEQLARQFDVDAVVDTGDLTSFGASVERLLGRLVQDFPVPYLYVPGNHDSEFNRRAIARRRNVVLLDKSVHDIGGISIMGWADPTFTASNEITTSEGNERREREAPLVAGVAAAENPHVLAVHDVRLASEALGNVPLVLAGHTHDQKIDEVEGTVVLTVGSTGATGVGSFLVESDAPYEAEVVYFRGGRPVAVDYIKFQGLGSDFEVQRRTLPPI